MNKKSIIFSFVMMLLFIAGTMLYAREDGRRSGSDDLQLEKSGLPRSTRLNINNMSHWFRADGWSARDPRTGNSGVIFPRGISEQLAVIFQDGLIWGGQVQDGATPTLRVGGQTYNIGTVEGKIISQGVAENPDAADVRIYRVRRDYATADLSLDAEELGSTEGAVRAQYATDWAEWPWEKGAPWTGIDNELDSGYLGPDGTTVMGAGNGILDRGEDANANGILDAGEDANGNEKLDGEFPGIAGADQVVWTVANDLSEGATFGLYGAPPIGLEMQLTAWGYQRTDALGNMIFKQLRLIYKGTANTPADGLIDPMYITQWSDPDLGTYTDDFVGVDVEKSLSFVYNSSSVDPTYNGFGFPPPAAGYDFFQGVLVPGDPTDEGIFGLKKRSGFKNLPLSSFGYFAAGASFSDPGPLGSFNGTIEWWNLLRGFLPQSDPNNPEPYTDNITGAPTLFPLSGDPTGSGPQDIDGILLPPGDRRMLMVTGPFTMALGDTQEVVVSLIAAIGSDRLSSVSVLKFFDKTAQATFDNLFKVVSPPAGPVVKATSLDGQILLNWGFDATAVEATESQDDAGFKFEGYNVYQLKSSSPDLGPGNAIKLATFDLVNEVTTVLSERFDTNSGVIVDVPVQVGTNSGIKRFFSVTEDAFRDRPLANHQDFFFAVTAYNATTDLSKTDRALESTPVIIAVRAKQPAPGVRVNASFGQTLEVTHDGPSDGNVSVMVVDPAAVTGHDYKVTFAEDPELGAVWNLTDVTTGETVLANQTKQIADAADQDFLTADGLLVQVFGAPLDIQRASDGSPAIIEVAGPNGPLTEPDFDGRGAPFGGNLVWHSFNAFGADGLSWFLGAGGGSGGESRMLRGNNIANGVPFDFEWRFGPTSFHWWAFDNGEVTELPFQFWNVGLGTFDDPTDDKQMITLSFSGGNTPGVFDFVNGENFFGASKCTDWVYVYDYTGTYADWNADLADGAVDNDVTTNEILARMIICDGEEFGGPPIPGLDPAALGGTVIRYITTKPNTGNDEFTFSTAEIASTESVALAKTDALQLVNVFPNPYLGVNRLETSSSNRFVRFTHLPSNAKIRIFNLAGTLVRALPDADPAVDPDSQGFTQLDQYMDWNLQNAVGLPAASGIYIAHIEMPGIGSKVLKLMIIQEEQFLRTF